MRCSLAVPGAAAAAPTPADLLRLLAARLALALLVCLSTLAGPATAQGTAPAEPAATAAPTAVEVDALIATLNDEAARARLIRQLELLRAADPAAEAPQETEFAAIGTAAVAYVASAFSGVEEAVERFTFAVTTLPDLARGFAAAMTDPVARDGVVRGVLQLVVAVGSAAIAYGVTQRLLAGLRRLLGRRAEGTGPLARLVITAARLVLDLVPVAFFLAAGFVALGAMSPSRPVEAFVLTVLNAGAVTGVLAALMRAFLAPRTPALRLAPMSDATAQSLESTFLATAGVAVWGYFFVGSLYLLGLGFSARWGLLLILGFVVAVAAIRFVLRWRRPFAVWLGTTVPEGRWYSVPVRRLAASWHRIAIVYILFVCIVGALQIRGGFAFLARGTIATVLVVTLLPLIATRVGGALDAASRGWPALAGARGRRYRALARSIIVAALWVAGIVILAEGWNLGALDFLKSEAGVALAGIFGRIAFVVAAGFLAWEVASIAIESRLEASKATATLGQRGRTLLQFLRNVVMVLILLMVTLIVLSEVGVDIGPLLAGAGVVGLAVGFGAQTAVKDVITGLFILLEDQVQVGDVVDLGNGFSGSVEALSIRTIRLRDFAGTVQIVPFSSVDRVKNLTRGFAFAVFDVNIGYKEDVDRVIAVLRRLGEELRADPQFAPHLLGDLEIYGLDQFGPSALVIKTRFKTLAGSQWTITREFNGRIKRAFDAEGIEIPFNYQTVTLPTGPDGKTMPIPLEIVGHRRPPASEPPAPRFRAPDAQGDEAPASDVGGGSR